MDESQQSNRLNSVSYATVREFCASVDQYPDLATHQQDLKDAQRPWAVKTISNFLPPGARLLEIGAGVPLAAAVLVGLGYEVTVCDPLDGQARGPENYKEIKKHFPQVRIWRDVFTEDYAKKLNETFDCVYSISVLEHLSPESLTDLFAAMRLVLKPRGYSIHAVDHVQEGQGQEFHEQQLQRVYEEQNEIAATKWNRKQCENTIQSVLMKSRKDLETYYLSAAGHNLWRGNLSYDEFPFRKCISMQFVAQR